MMLYFNAFLILVGIHSSVGAASKNDDIKDSSIGSRQHIRGTMGENCKGFGCKEPLYLTRVATFPVCKQINEFCDTGTETVAEIVVVTDDGNTAVYTDSERGVLGFVDITDPKNPDPLGVTNPLGGELTSVVLKGSFALVVVNTSVNFVDTSGKLLVVNVTDRTVVKEIDLGGQPDSIAISPDKNYAVVAIENERDEDAGDGGLPQMPAGFVVIIDIADNEPANWSTHNVDITGLDGVYEPSDPEPEFVSINEDNFALVSLQENNAAVIIDVESKEVTSSFSFGSVNLANIDATSEDIISMTESQSDVKREPDGVTWIGEDYFATANEGDLNGGSRGFTIFRKDGTVAYESGSSVEHLVARFGHYPEGRSRKKGNEPENVVYAKSQELLFVSSERANVVLVYDVSKPFNPKFLQVLPCGLGPEGGYWVDSRDDDRELYIAAAEVDNRNFGKIRSSLVIYEYGETSPDYPTLESVDDADIGNGVPLAWGAISGLSPPAKPVGQDKFKLYAVDDSAYKKSRIFVINTKTTPAQITEDIYIKDTNDVFASLPTPLDEDDEDFTAAELAAMINDDKTVNIDSEGIVQTVDGFWVVSEGKGTKILGPPITSLNFLFKLDMDGVIEKVVKLPDNVNSEQRTFGFEGVTAEGDYVVVAFQREWGETTRPRIGLYNTVTDEWKFVFYPLDEVESPNGGWVGLSEISSLGEGKFLVLERDNQGQTDARIKRIYSISLGDLDEVTDNDVIGDDIPDKELVRDLINDYLATGGVPLEKPEGMAVLGNNVWVINDNDAVDFDTGETQLIKFPLEE